MPMVDMPLEKLKTYMGCSPCPDDIDAFWDRSLSELDAIDPKTSILPHPYAARIAECFDLTYTSTKGARIYAKLARPRGLTGKAPAVLLFHGLSGSSSDWQSLLSWVSQGYVAAFMDCRGQGGLSEDVGGVAGTTYTTPFTRGLDGRPEDLLCRDIFLDTAMLARIVMGLDYVDADRIGVTGGSQGGALSVACAALVPQIKLCAPIYPYLSDYKRVWSMDLDKGAYEGLRYYFRHFDPTHEHEDEIFLKLGYIDLQNLAKRIRAKVLMSTGLMDTTCPPSTQFAIYNKLTCEKDMVIYPDYGHEGLKGNSDIVFEFMAQL